MRWIVVTNKREIIVKAERRIDVEKRVWKKLAVGEELLFILSERIIR